MEQDYTLQSFWLPIIITPPKTNILLLKIVVGRGSFPFRNGPFLGPFPQVDLDKPSSMDGFFQVRPKCFENRRHNKTDSHSHSHSKHPQKTGGLYFLRFLLYSFFRQKSFTPPKTKIYPEQNAGWMTIFLSKRSLFRCHSFIRSFWGAGTPPKKTSQLFQNQLLAELIACGGFFRYRTEDSVWI